MPKQSSKRLPRGVHRVARKRGPPKYVATITREGHNHFLGTFITPDAAHQAFRAAANEHAKRRNHHPRYTSDRYSGLEEHIIQQLGRFPISSRALYERVIVDYGEVNFRIFYRYLVKLKSNDQVTVDEEWPSASRRGNPTRFYRRKSR